MLTLGDLSPQTQERIRRALADAYAVELNLRRESGRRPRRADVILRVMTEALHVLRRLPDNEMRWIKAGMQSTWRLHFTLSDDERLNAYRQMQWLVVKGLESEEFLLARTPVSPSEQATMEDVFEVFRACCIGKDVGRDWTMIYLTAAGMRPAVVGRHASPRVNAGFVKNRVDLQCCRIGYVLRDLFPQK